MTIRLQQPLFKGFFELRNAANFQIGGVNNSAGVIDLTLLTSGTFKILLFSSDPPAAYTLHVSVENHKLNGYTEVISSLPNLRRLTLPVPGLSPVDQNLTSLEGTAVTLTTTTSGVWSVLNPAGATLASGTGTTVAFTPTGTGQYTVTHVATGTFPFFSQNIAPVVQGVAKAINLIEGDTRTAAQLLTASGFTASDFGSVAPSVRVSVEDLSGNLVANLTPTSLKFDGVDDIVTFTPSQSAPSVPIGNSSYTLAAWINPDTMGDNGIIGWGKYGNNTEVNALRLSSNGLVNYWWGNDLSVTTGSLVGGWHHVAVTYDGTERIIYLDGARVGSDKPGVKLNVPSDVNFAIGRTSTLHNEFFNGLIDDVQVWNKALSPADLATAKAGRLKSDTPNLVGYWTFDETLDNVAPDSSASGRSLVLGSGNPSRVPTVSQSSPADISTNFHPADEGDYLLKVLAVDANGASDVAYTTIHVDNATPTAAIVLQSGAAGFSSGLQAGNLSSGMLAGNPIKLNALSSSDVGENDSLNYLWSVSTNNDAFFAASNKATLEFVPPVAGSYQVKLTVTDSDGAVSQEVSRTLNVAPAQFTLTQPTGTEGSAILMDVVDAPALPSGAIRTWAWKAYVTVNLDVIVGNTRQFAFVPIDDVTYQVELTITDTIGTAAYSTTSSTTVAVANQAPSIDFGGTTFGTEGSNITLSPVIHDAGVNDTLTYLWTIKDLQGAVVSVAGPINQATLNFVPVDNGVYTATLTVTDNAVAPKTGSTIASTTVIVANVAPIVSGPAQAFYSEDGANNNVVGFEIGFSDPGTSDGPFTYAWDFGDGTQSVGTSATMTIPATTHAYADSGTYNATLTVTDRDGAKGRHTTQVNIANVAPTNLLISGPAAANQNSTVTFTGSVRDFNGLLHATKDSEALRGSIDFGDGVVLPILLANPGRNGRTADYTFNSRHIYAKPGTYTVRVTVADDDGGETIATKSITINGVLGVSLSSTAGAEGGSNVIYTIQLSKPVPVGETLTVDFATGTVGTATMTSQP